MNVAVGIDASGRRIGYAIISVDSEEILGGGVALLPPHDETRNLVVEWRRIAQKIHAAATRGRGDVVVVGVEDVYLGPNRRGSLDHALVVGGVLALAQRSFPDALILPVAAAQWKQHIGVSTVGKSEALEWAIRRVGHEIGQDEADALGIAVTSAGSWRGVAG